MGGGESLQIVEPGSMLCIFLLKPPDGISLPLLAHARVSPWRGGPSGAGAVRAGAVGPGPHVASRGRGRRMLREALFTRWSLGRDHYSERCTERASRVHRQPCGAHSRAGPGVGEPRQPAVRVGPAGLSEALAVGPRSLLVASFDPSCFMLSLSIDVPRPSVKRAVFENVVLTTT